MSPLSADRDVMNERNNYGFYEQRHNSHSVKSRLLVSFCYTHDTRSRNRRRHKSTPIFFGADFWYVCHANLGPDSSGTGFRRRLEYCSIPSQKVAFTCLTEMIIYE